MASRQCDVPVCDARKNHSRATSQRPRRVLLLREVHVWQRDNEYILSGYRYILPHLLLQVLSIADLLEHARLGVIVDLRRQSRSVTQSDGQYLFTSYRRRGFHRLPIAVVSGQSRYIQMRRVGGLSRC